MARRTTAQNPLAGLSALVDLANALQGIQAQPTKAAPAKREFKGALEGYRSVAVLSVEEAQAVLKASKSGKNETITVGNRETVVEVLSAEDAATFKGGFRIHRRTLPSA